MCKILREFTIIISRVSNRTSMFYNLGENSTYI